MIFNWKIPKLEKRQSHSKCYINDSYHTKFMVIASMLWRLMHAKASYIVPSATVARWRRNGSFNMSVVDSVLQFTPASSSSSTA
jgi:hypothetical protein